MRFCKGPCGADGVKYYHLRAKERGSSAENQH